MPLTKYLSLWAFLLMLACAAEAASVVQLDADGTAMVDGQRTLVIGAYRDPSDDWQEFSNLRNSGFNLTHDYHFETDIKSGYTAGDVTQIIADAELYLTLAGEADMGVALGIPREFIINQDLSALTSYVNATKDYDALWFWYLADEPSLQGAAFVAGLDDAYNLLKSLDANHPAVIVDGIDRLNANPNLVLYADLIWIDRYHVPYGVFEIKRDIAEAQATFPNEVFWAVPDAHDRQPYLQPDWVSEPYPETASMNDMNTYQGVKPLRALAHGCLSVEQMQGIIYYWGPNWWQDMLTETPSVWEGLRAASNELKALQDALLSTESTEGVEISYSRCGMYERMNQLYGYELNEADYPAADHVNHWIRQHNGSIYIGMTATYVPRQLVSVKLPFEFGRVVQYPDQKTIMRRIEGEKADVLQGVSDVVIWNVPNYRNVSFILNDIDVAVWRIDSIDPTQALAYGEEFTGSNGAMPVGWTVHQGLVDIRSNAYATRSNDGERTVSTFVGEGSADWEDYTFSCRLRQNYAFPENAGTTSPFFTGVAFRVQDSENYYLASIKKLAGSANPKLVISKVSAGVEVDLAKVALEPYMMEVLTWYDLTVEAYGSRLEARLALGEEPLAGIDTIDDSYRWGSIGVHSVMPYPYHSYYDDFALNGRQLAENGRCLMLKASGAELASDFNDDCLVGFDDLMFLIENWLNCVGPACNP